MNTLITLINNVLYKNIEQSVGRYNRTPTYTNYLIRYIRTRAR